MAPIGAERRTTLRSRAKVGQTNDSSPNRGLTVTGATADQRGDSARTHRCYRTSGAWMRRCGSFPVRKPIAQPGSSLYGRLTAQEVSFPVCEPIAQPGSSLCGRGNCAGGSLPYMGGQLRNALLPYVGIQLDIRHVGALRDSRCGLSLHGDLTVQHAWRLSSLYASPTVQAVLFPIW